MPRFFTSPDNVSLDAHEAVILGNDARHIARSLRMAVGDAVTVCDGLGNEYECRLTYIRDEECRCEVLKNSSPKSEPPKEITLYMAYPKSDKLEFVVQKSVELGVSKIVPFISERCIKRPKAEKEERQTERLSRIAEEAAKQCGRTKLPTVEAPISYKELISRIKSEECVLFCYEGEGAAPLSSVLRETGAGKISVAVGSEGGFTEEEAKLAREAGAKIVNLGPRILRCETAPLYCLSAISYEFEL